MSGKETLKQQPSLLWESMEEASLSPNLVAPILHWLSEMDHFNSYSLIPDVSVLLNEVQRLKQSEQVELGRRMLCRLFECLERDGTMYAQLPRRLLFPPKIQDVYAQTTADDRGDNPDRPLWEDMLVFQADGNTYYLSRSALQHALTDGVNTFFQLIG